MIINKKVIRDLKENFIKNLIFTLLIILSISLLIGFNRSMNGSIDSINKFYKQYNVEDGQFIVLEDIDASDILDKFNIKIEKMEYYDYKLSDNETIRIFKERKNINRYQVTEGKKLRNKKEILIDSWFAKKHNYRVNDTIEINKNGYKLKGFAISPDYVNTLKTKYDFLFNPKYFGIAYVSEDDFENFNDTKFYYSFKSSKEERKKLKKYIKENYTLLDWINKEDNSRINNVINDLKGPKELSKIICTMLNIVVAFVIALSIKKRIKDESSIIGTLYSLGYNKKELLIHYIKIPILLSVIGSLIGYVIGIIISKPLIMTQSNQYNFPIITLSNFNNLLLKGLIIPIVIILVVNIHIIRKDLSKKPLNLLYSLESNKINKLEEIFRFENVEFNKRFRIKGMLRDIESIIVLTLGIFLSSLIILISFGLKDSINKYVKNIKEDINYKYLYFITTETIDDRKEGEKTLIKELKLKNSKVTIQGIEEDSRYLDLKDTKGKSINYNKVMIADTVAKKLNIHKGDKITLYDEIEDKYYFIKAEKIVKYTNGQFIFMPINKLNKLLNKENSFNGLMSNEKLNLDEKMVFTDIEKKMIVTSTEELMKMFKIIIYILIIVSIVITIGIIYLIMSMVIEKNKIGISLFKILGYNNNEISRLFIEGNIVFVIVSFLMAIPICKVLINIFCKKILEGLSIFIEAHIYKSNILIAFTFIFISYIISNFIVKKEILNIHATEVLKNRE
ncbi:ABC-type transport system, involved in lipoprotein release, permease component [Gottschalkia purinilytica]|uniref:ABC-type transport system, involved in lipoprotein release, permease component n=1 Tax=Gottschalkia purinilytica TaxID=1503 RepID=A0A0L0WBW9_GOTPU|nr:ABC transporter permease [Gottschalkia purinilytica]KNF08962.1 ABC-type transport system, involved in lipoprotein release, permease component [Gottschalkia purinilytica]